MACAFCGEEFSAERPRSQEHAWAKSLADLLPGSGSAFRFTVAHDDTGEVLTTWTSDELDVVTKKVCRQCNHGWMARLEASARPYLESIVPGFGRTLYREGQTQLAAWASKTALAVSLATPRRLPIPKAHYLELARNHLPKEDSTQVWIGGFHGSFHGHHRSHKLTLTSPISGRQFDGYYSTVLLGHAVFQVFGHTHPEKVELGKRGRRAESTVQIWSIERERVTFPADLMWTDENFRELSQPPGG